MTADEALDQECARKIAVAGELAADFPDAATALAEDCVERLLGD
jgi:hypothetical protein